ncbi:hypothetical protein PYCC9005_000457 [Savitreella phatthalungensis]
MMESDRPVPNFSRAMSMRELRRHLRRQTAMDGVDQSREDVFDLLSKRPVDKTHLQTLRQSNEEDQIVSLQRQKQFPSFDERYEAAYELCEAPRNSARSSASSELSKVPTLMDDGEFEVYVPGMRDSSTSIETPSTVFSRTGSQVLSGSLRTFTGESVSGSSELRKVSLGCAPVETIGKASTPLQTYSLLPPVPAKEGEAPKERPTSMLPPLELPRQDVRVSVVRRDVWPSEKSTEPLAPRTLRRENPQPISEQPQREAMTTTTAVNSTELDNLTNQIMGMAMSQASWQHDLGENAALLDDTTSFSAPRPAPRPRGYQNKKLPEPRTGESEMEKKTSGGVDDVTFMMVQSRIEKLASSAVGVPLASGSGRSASPCYGFRQRNGQGGVLHEEHGKHIGGGQKKVKIDKRSIGGPTLLASTSKHVTISLEQAANEQRLRQLAASRRVAQNGNGTGNKKRRG